MLSFYVTAFAAIIIGSEAFISPQTSWTGSRAVHGVVFGMMSEGPGESSNAMPSSARASALHRVTSKVSLIGAAAAVLGTFPAFANAAGASYNRLEEPTPEFKKEMARVAKFKEAQTKIKNNWDATLARFNAADDPKALEKELKNLKAIIDDLHGIPVGVNKMATVRNCRAKKYGSEAASKKRSKKKMEYWTKDVEIAYQGFILSYNRETNPDTTTRDTNGPEE